MKYSYKSIDGLSVRLTIRCLVLLLHLLQESSIARRIAVDTVLAK